MNKSQHLEEVSVFFSSQALQFLKEMNTTIPIEQEIKKKVQQVELEEAVFLSEEECVHLSKFNKPRSTLVLDLIAAEASDALDIFYIPGYEGQE